MKHTITKLTPIETQLMVSDFLKTIGGRLRAKRTKKSLSQEEIAYCLDIDQSTLSKYENGDRDMSISLLPQFSTYCKFPMYELFPRDESQMILDSFAKAVKITVKHKKRQDTKSIDSDRILKGQLYDVNGKEVFVPAKTTVTKKSKREMYKDAELHSEYEPYSQEMFCNYIVSKKDISSSIIEAGAFLSEIMNMPKKETLRTAVADYIIDEAIINDVSKREPDEQSERAYAYYRMLYHRYMNSDLN